MKKRLWFLISILIAAALSFALAGCGSEGDTGYTGTVSYSWVTPGLLPTDSGYYEGNQTITMENGVATKAEAEMVVFLGEPWAGISLITVMHSSKSGSTRGIFRDVTSVKMYVDAGYISYGDPVPKVPIEPMYLWAESSIVWSGDDLIEMTAMRGATVLAKMSFDYEGGRRKAMRIFDTGSEDYNMAEYYQTWDATWDIPTEIWHFANEGDIPAGYDYEENSLELPRYFNTSDGIVDHRYTIALDGQGRIATMVEEVQESLINGGYYPYGLQVFTYEGGSQNMAGVTRYEDYTEGPPTTPGNWETTALSMTFDLPEESGFEMQEMMLEPMQRFFLPFIYQNDFLD